MYPISIGLGLYVRVPPCKPLKSVRIRYMCYELLQDAENAELAELDEVGLYISGSGF